MTTPTPSRISTTVDLVALIAVVDALCALVSAENEQLELGLPASIAQEVREKAQLALELENRLIEFRAGRLSGTATQMSALVAALGRLKPIMQVNTRLLRRAMRASRRRVDAIMQSLRAERMAQGSYGTDRRLQRAAQSSRNAQ